MLQANVTDTSKLHSAVSTELQLLRFATPVLMIGFPLLEKSTLPSSVLVSDELTTAEGYISTELLDQVPY